MDTPVSRNENSAQALGFESDDAKSRYQRMVDEAERTTLGPMPIQEFLTAFLPLQDETVLNDMPSPLYAFGKIPESPNDESEIYDPLILSMNGDEGQPSRCPGIKFMNTSNRVEYPNKRGSMKPDICGYTEQYTEFVRVPGTTSKAHTQMGYADLFFEIKKSRELDFFSDPPPGSTAAEHQTWIFVLNKKNYNKANLKGYDMTVQMATEEEEALFKEAISRKVEEQLGPLLEKSITDYDKITKRKKKTSKQAALEDAITEHYKAGVVTAVSMTGPECGGASRATRAYWALDTTLLRVVFLKDTWRYDIDRMDQEGDVLTRLNQLEIDHVPEVLYHGDILYEQWGAGHGGSEGMSQLTRTPRIL
ncbi:hypothetical protein A0H81_08660 [Grifola frondosa]|uniref:Fungal-type protein kinase domain-containing protein n=1 Tax=Grifola frondosa TaxID=5627 RepID=A0A1C7M3R5_GRIFR|nr:hypothetical protein A0H81_08660 [Grifola frondosa]